MLFPTIEFGIFLCVVFGAYWALRAFPVPRKLLLLAASYVFYGAWDWRFTFLMFGISFVNWAASLRIAALADGKKRKAWLVAALFLNLGVLAFFKYGIFAATNLNNLFLSLGRGAPLPILQIILPVGISFFTFQGMSYTIDVYRRKLEADRSLLDTLLYVAFFPQLVAGPIVRGTDFMPRLRDPDAGTPLELPRAFLLIVGGLFKKVILANYLAQVLVDPVFMNPSAQAGPTVLLGLYGYAFQIFCDFSAYSDIAIGVALLFGFRFPENFDQPYRAVSLQDFWRRWHISLSTWLRDYLYIPLGGNRKGGFRTYLNLLATMLLGGLWHGAAWTFVIWGGLHGLGLAVERFFSGLLKRLRGKTLPGEVPDRGFRRFLGSAGTVVGMALTFHFVCLCWVFFRSRSLSAAFAFLKSMANPLDYGPLPGSFALILLAAAALLQFIPRMSGAKLGEWFGRRHPAVQALILGSLLFGLGAMAPSGVAPFIYFQF